MKINKDFNSFVNEDNNAFGTPLRKYFNKNSLRHENIIGKKVIDTEGGEWYISNIDPIHDDSRLPYQIFCCRRPDSEFGYYINTNELFIPDDVDYVQSQVQESDQTIAREILKQLGGNKFIVMTGARQFVSDNNSLRFKIPRAKNGINFVKITLNSLDLYDVEYGKIFGEKYTVVNIENNIYDDMLIPSFEKNTGLYTKLF